MDDPTLQRYRPADRPEVFDFLRATVSPAHSARSIEQWDWKYETNPFNPPEGPIVFVMRLGTKIVSLVAGFRLPAWVAGAACEVENLGDWVVHPDYRRRRIWRQVDNRQLYQAPIAISWGHRLSARIGANIGWVPTRMNLLLRVLDPAQMIKHLSGSSALATIGAAAHVVTRVVAEPFRRDPQLNGTVARLEGFDERCDDLWERSRRDDLAMLLRNRRYLQWRYTDRPDAKYSLIGVERGSELLGVLVARITTRDGMLWGSLVDFLIAKEDAEGVFAMLIQAALDEFRRNGAVAVICYASQTSCRRILRNNGFVGVPQRDPTHFSLKVHPQHSNLEHFAQSRRWYITMGDGDLELAH